MCSCSASMPSSTGSRSTSGTTRSDYGAASGRRRARFRGVGLVRVVGVIRSGPIAMMRLRPDSLARYICASAVWTSTSGAAAGPTAQPPLIVTSISPPSIGIGSAAVATRMRSAT